MTKKELIRALDEAYKKIDNAISALDEAKESLNYPEDWLPNEEQVNELVIEPEELDTVNID